MKGKLMSNVRFENNTMNDTAGSYPIVDVYHNGEKIGHFFYKQGTYWHQEHNTWGMTTKLWEYCGSHREKCPKTKGKLKKYIRNKIQEKYGELDDAIIMPRTRIVVEVVPNDDVATRVCGKYRIYQEGFEQCRILTNDKEDGIKRIKKQIKDRFERNLKKEKSREIITLKEGWS